MTEFTFVHAADLHLDAPFRGLRQTLPDDARTVAAKKLVRLLREATFIALERLTDLCIQTNADFLLLAGDVYNSAESSLRARLALRDAFLRLEGAGIRVFLAHGNHDPLQDETAIPWPDNVTVFGNRVTTCVAGRRGEGPETDQPLALVHGISHSGPREGRNLARLFKRRPHTLLDPDMYQIGLLHCALADMSGAHEAYAPCAFADLVEAEMDYWALGHVHAPRLLDRRGRPLPGPEAAAFAAYAGSVQGLNINETGAHGCLLARVDAKGRTVVTPIPLAPVRWEQIVLEPGSDIAGIPSLERLLLDRLETFAPQSPLSGQELAGNGATADDNSAPPLGHAPEAVIVRVSLRGRTSLNHELRKPDAAATLRERLEAELSGIGVWVREILVATRPLLDVDAVAARPDLAGEAMRAGLALCADPEHLARTAERTLAPLFQRARLRKLVTEPDAGELAALAEEAAFLCLDLLGVEDLDEEEAGKERD